MRMIPMVIHATPDGFDSTSYFEAQDLDDADEIFNELNADLIVAAEWIQDEQCHRISPMRVYPTILQIMWDEVTKATDENGVLIRDVSPMHPKGTKLVAVQHFFEDVIGDSWMEDIMKGEWR